MIRRLEGRFGIARREWRLLGLLAVHGPLSPSALADEAQLDRPRTSRAIGAPAAEGLLLHETLPGDARLARVALADAGRRLHDEILAQVAAINAAVLGALDEPSVQSLDRAPVALTERARVPNTELVRNVRAGRRGGGSRRFRPAVRSGNSARIARYQEERPAIVGDVRRRVDERRPGGVALRRIVAVGVGAAARSRLPVWP